MEKSEPFQNIGCDPPEVRQRLVLGPAVCGWHGTLYILIEVHVAKFHVEIYKG